MPGLIICGSILSNQQIKSSPDYPFNIEYLVVAGGGGAGKGESAGAGAGGFRTGYTPIPASCVNTIIPIIVGAGGTGSTSQGTRTGMSNGSASYLSNLIISTGGGMSGIGWTGVQPYQPAWGCGCAGGSGGGSISVGFPAGAGNLGGYTPVEGYPGGCVVSGPGVSAGGGGAGGPGGNQTSASGVGGIGANSGITGVSIAYAGGGAASYNGGFALGGCGGGGHATGSTGFSGNVNTGGGAGGSGTDVSTNGASGGSGIVVVRYPGPQRALGGNTYACNGNTIHIFRSSGNLCFSPDFLEPLSYPFAVCYLVVAGGGAGGGYGSDGGGGGAGGLLNCTSHTISADGQCCIIIGAGGVAQSWPTGYPTGCRGSNSSFGTITAVGGGGGATYDNTPAQSGGSGGGAGGAALCAPGTTYAGSGISGQGCPGGQGIGAACSNPGYPYAGQGTVYAAGQGGGGASECGFGCFVGGGGLHCNMYIKGGNGCLLSINGNPVWYAGGGGGGHRTYSASICSNEGGCGGGGRGGQEACRNAMHGNVNTGGGGGGGGCGPSSPSAGCGGSGIVIIAYPGQQRASGGTITCVSGRTIHTFLSSSNICFCSCYIT